MCLNLNLNKCTHVLLLETFIFNYVDSFIVYYLTNLSHIIEINITKNKLVK